MLYEVVVNDWGETTYIPTTLGNGLLATVIVILLLAAVFFARNPAKKQNRHSIARGGQLTVKQLAFCAMAIALGTVLANIKLFRFPTGGSITLLSMLVCCLPGYFLVLV